MRLKCCFEMGQCELYGTVRVQGGRLAQSGQCRSNPWLSVGETLPEMVSGGERQAALELSKGFEFVIELDSRFKEQPQVFGRKEAMFDSTSDPDAEGPATSGSGYSTIVTEEARGPNRFFELML